MERLRDMYPGLKTLQEAMPERSFTIDAQEMASDGAILAAGPFPSPDYDLERTNDGRTVLSFVTWSGIMTKVYVVRVECDENQANALRARARQPTSHGLRVAFRLTNVSRPVLGVESDVDEEGTPKTGVVRIDQLPALIFQGTLLAVDG